MNKLQITSPVFPHKDRRPSSSDKPCRFFKKEGLAVLIHAPRMCLRCFPLDGAKFLHPGFVAKGMRMTISGSTRETVYNNAGAGAPQTLLKAKSHSVG